MIIGGLSKRKKYGAIFSASGSCDITWCHYFLGKALSPAKTQKIDEKSKKSKYVAIWAPYYDHKLSKWAKGFVDLQQPYKLL